MGANPTTLALARATGFSTAGVQYRLASIEGVFSWAFSFFKQGAFKWQIDKIRLKPT
jgi:hypothetical protein